MNILHLDSSILGEASVSRPLGRRLVDGLRRRVPGAQVRHRDLSAQPVPPVDAALLAARARPATDRQPDEQARVAAAQTVLDELLAADLLVIGVPMYNFAVPLALKAWIDQVAVAGVTFRYGPDGPQGLLQGKRAVLVATAGGRHQGQPTGAAHADHLRLVLQFLGIRDVHLVSVQGLAMGPAAREAAVERATAEIETLVDRLAPATEPA